MIIGLRLLLAFCLLLGMFRLNSQEQSFTYFTSSLSTDSTNTAFVASEEFGESIYSVGVEVIGEFEQDLIVAKHSLHGELEDVFRIDTTNTSKGIESGDQFILNSNGNFLVVYSKGTFEINSGLVNVLCFSPEGDVLWQVEFNDNSETDFTVRKPFEIVQDQNDDLIICGWEQQVAPIALRSRGFLLKLSADGGIIWKKTYAESSENETKFGALAVTFNNEILVGGVIEVIGQNGGTPNDHYLLKVDNEGVVQWSKTWGTDGNDTVSDLLATIDGHFLAKGTQNSNTMNENSFIWKFDNEGALINENFFDSSDNTIISGLAGPLVQMQSGDVFFRTGKFTEDWSEITGIIGKFSPQLDLEWIEEVSIFGIQTAVSRDLDLLSDNSLLLTGFTFATDETPQLGWLMKMDTLAQTCSYLGCDSTVIDTSTYSGYLDSFDNGIYYLSLSPNPLIDGTVSLSYDLPQENPQAWWYVYNLNGQLLRSRKLSTSEYYRKIELGTLHTGTYLWHLNIGNKKMTSGKFQVTK